MGAIVAITGAGHPLGRRLVRRALADPGVERVVALEPDPDAGPLEPDGERLVTSRVALDDTRLGPLLADVTDVVLVPPVRGPELDGSGGAEPDLLAVRGFLGTLGRRAHVRQLVVVSSALVYGARADNPVPLTEDAPVRPNPGIPAAGARAELEVLAAGWASAHHARVVAVRPCVVLAPEQGRWIARSPWASAGLQVAGRSAPVQFLHVDDLASAVDLLRREGADGALNVAPDGWLTADDVRSLKGPTPRLRLPKRWAVPLARWAARFGLGSLDPSVLLASSAPWVVANDRMRALGWEPEHTSEEAYVEADPGTVWNRLTPRHRQQIGLGVVGGAVLAVVATVALLVRRRLRSGSSG